jgi:hypothetical protein
MSHGIPTFPYKKRQVLHVVTASDPAIHKSLCHHLATAM